MQPVAAELVRGPDGVYHIDFQAFEGAITANTRLFILCNPHNPVGRVFTRDELGHLADICLRRGVTICSDEVHSDLLFPGHRHIPLAALDPEIAQHTITLIAPSKTFNLAGLQCAIAIIQNAGLREQFVHANQGLVGWNNLLGMVAGQAAYAEGQEWLEQLLVYLQANRDYLSDFVRDGLPGIAMSPVEGTYLAWLDCREAGILGNPFQFFIENGRVALSDGADFGSGGEGFVRLNFGCPRAMLAEALGRMRAALEKKPLAL
jgi:cystathionine beta-lyase